MDYFVLRFDHGYRKKDILALSKLSGKVLRKWSGRLISAFGLLVALFLLITGIFRLCTEGWGAEQAFWTVLGVGMLALTFFKARLNAWGARRQAIRVENLTMKFSDEGLTQSSDKATALAPYSAMERLMHYRGCYFLFVDRLHAYILPEDRFVVGDSADFRAFIEAKTGKTVEYI